MQGATPATEAKIAPTAAFGRERRPGRISLPALHKPSRHVMAILVVLALTLAFYMWTAASTIGFFFPTNSSDPYNLLTTAFLHGHLYLPTRVPPGLLHLSDPYGPKNLPYTASYLDLALYKGHFYSAWGPTPAVTLFLLFRITGHEMSQSFAVAFFAFIGLACSVALLHLLVRRLVPRTPNWMLLVATIGLALTNVAPFLLRRPIQYEVAISSGYCFAMAGMLLVVSALVAPSARRWRLAFGSLCLGLAAGGRPDLAVTGLVAVAAAIYLVRRRGEPLSLLIPALGPLIVCGLLLGAYNVARFGSVTQFGNSYQISAKDMRHLPLSRAAYIPPGAFSYLLIPPRFAVTFPHVFLMTDAQYPFPEPALYARWQQEVAGGVLPTMPITLLLLGLPVLWWRHRPSERGAIQAATGLALLGLLIVVVLSYALPGTTQRYEVDFATFLLMSAFLVWALLLARCRPRSIRRRFVAAAGIVLTAFGSAVGVALSFTGYFNLLDYEHPGLFRTLEDITSPFATVATMIGGRPVLTRVDGSSVSLPALGYGDFGEAGASAWLGAGQVTVTVISPGTERTAITAVAARGPQAPPHAAVVVTVQSPGQAPRYVPVSSGNVRLPIRLHWGLNRIEVNTLAPNPAIPQQLSLSDIRLGS